MAENSKANWPTALIWIVFIICSFGSCVYCESIKHGVSPITIDKHYHLDIQEEDLPPPDQTPLRGPLPEPPPMKFD